MYDMYPWDRNAAPDRGPAKPTDPATRAVQVALDRRDNGGDAAAPPDLPPGAVPAPAPGTSAPRGTRQ